ncbi:YeiH family protein [soil metagenome]
MRPIELLDPATSPAGQFSYRQNVVNLLRWFILRLPAALSIGWRTRISAMLIIPALINFLPGLLLSALLAAMSIALGQLPYAQEHALSALTMAIVLGMVCGNTFFPRISVACLPGLAVAKRHLLRLGIVLYGVRLTFQDVGQVGIAGVLIDAIMLSSTFALALLVGVKLLKLDRVTVMLIGAGSSICGAAAIMATEPVLRARAGQVTVAIATVVVFGSAAMLLYPFLYELNVQWHWLALTPAQFGIYLGASVHEVAQVVAAGRAVSPEVANAAVIAKMVRVMILAPFLLMLSAYVTTAQRQPESDSRPPQAVATGLSLPWFSLVFIAMVGLNSVLVLPPALVSSLTELDTFLLAMAMAALGLTTHVSAIRQAGVKPLLLAGVLFLWLIGGGALLSRLVTGWLV